jgi:hypothetical protein
MPNDRIEVAADYTSAWNGDEMVWMAPTSQVARGLLGHQNQLSGLLTPVVRWIGPNGRVWIWERKPRFLQSFYIKNNQKNIFGIMLPWTIELLDFDTGTLIVFARNSPLMSMDDGLCYLPMPGLGPQGQVPIPKLTCTGSVDVTIMLAKQAFDEAVWAGAVPEERLPPEFKGTDPMEMFTLWHAKSLLDVTSTKWPLAMPLHELVATYDTVAPVPLQELFEKAAGQRS